MKKLTLIFLACLAIGWCLPAPGFALFGFFERNYYVLFDEVPNIIDEGIYNNQKVIGKVKSKEVKDGFVVVKIEIIPEEEPRMVEGVVFYVDNGKLTYSQLEDKGKPLPRDAKILGFVSQLKMTMFRARQIGEGLAGALRQTAEEIYAKVKK